MTHQLAWSHSHHDLRAARAPAALLTNVQLPNRDGIARFDLETTPNLTFDPQVLIQYTPYFGYEVLLLGTHPGGGIISPSPLKDQRQTTTLNGKVISLGDL